MHNKLLPFQGPRLIFFKVVVIACFMVLIFRLYEWQFTRYDEFVAGAQENAIQSVPLPAPRGVIYDRNGVGLALNAPAFNVAVIPAGLPDDTDEALAVLNRLSALIDVPATRAAADAAGKKNVRSLEEMVKEGEGIAPYRAVIVATDVTQTIAQQILEDNRNLPGVDVEYGPVRQYPSGATTSQIVGYLGPIGAAEAEKLRAQGYNPAFERVGYAGVEAYLDDQLSGKRGLLTREVDVAGLPVRTIKRDEPVAGKNVRLSIDLDLQKGAERALTDRLSYINTSQLQTVTQSGVVIAMNPNTGEILAMVSWPSYDNTKFARAIDAEYYMRELNDPQLPLVNHAVQSLYPPGSTWKLLTATGVAQEHVIDPHSYLEDKGELFVTNSYAPNDPGKRQRFVCWYRKGHGQVDLIHGIAWSCDVYFYQIGGGNPDVSTQTLRDGGLGIKDLDRYATMFGIGTSLGVELPGEVAGRMPDPDWKRRLYGESWSTGDTYNAAFGQGYVTVTPLQLINAVATITNGGTLYQPTFINSWVDAENNVLQPLQTHVQRTIALPPDGTLATLNMREDMYVQGKNSLSCVCEPDSPFNDPTDKEFYDPNMPKCTADFIRNYRATVHVDRDMNSTDSVHNWIDVPYTVSIPDGYTFRNVCDPLQFKPGYQPPFVDPQNLAYVREGMRLAITDPQGTGYKPFLNFGHDVAGKTGTAEYCDNIAAQKGLCHAGSWPSHAWFVAFAPYEQPEIIAIAFIYNGGEGSANALPVVKETLNCYFFLKDQRAKLGQNAPMPACPSIQFEKSATTE